MTNFLNRADALGVGKYFGQGSQSQAVKNNSGKDPITLDQIIQTAQSLNSSTYIQNNLYRARDLGTPGPVIPTITLKTFIANLIDALAELFRSRGYERIADYLLAQHDLEAVFGQLATRIQSLNRQTLERTALIEKYQRINTDAATLVVDELVPITSDMSPTLVGTMTDAQRAQLNAISSELDGFKSQAASAVFDDPASALDDLAASKQFIAPDGSQIGAGIIAAGNVLDQLQNNPSTRGPLIPASSNPTGLTNSNTLISAANSLQQSTYLQSNTQRSLNLLKGISNTVAGNATPLYPPLYVAGQAYSSGMFVTYGYRVYQCVNSTTGSPESDPNSWLDTGTLPAGGAYELKSLTSAVSSDVGYLAQNGQVSYSQGTEYNTGQNIIHNGQNYYATKDLDIGQLGVGAFNPNDVVKASNGQIYKNTNGINIVHLENGASYRAGDIIEYNGNYYKATSDGTYLATPPSDFSNVSGYGAGTLVSYGGQIYQATAGNGSGYFQAGNGGSASLGPGGSVGVAGNYLYNYNIPSDLYAVVDYYGGGQGTITGSNTYDPVYYSSGNPRGSYNNGNVKLTQSGEEGEDRYVILATPDGKGYPNGFVANFDLNLGGQSSNGFSFSYVDDNDPARVHDHKGGGYANGAGVTGMSVLFDDANNSNVNDNAFGVKIVSFANAGTGPFDHNGTTVGDSPTNLNNNQYRGLNHVTIWVKNNQFTVQFMGQTVVGTFKSSYTPDDSWVFVLGASTGGTASDQTVTNLVISPAPASITNISKVYSYPPDQNVNFKSLGSLSQITPPDQAGSNFASYDVSTDTGNWQVYNPANDSSRWSSGISPKLVSTQVDLKAALAYLKTLYDTTSITPGSRWDFLSLTGGMPDDGTQPPFKTFGITTATVLLANQRIKALQDMNALINTTSPNFAEVRNRANQLKALVTALPAATLVDDNQYWGQILSGLNSLIDACNRGDKAAALVPLALQPPNLDDTSPNPTLPLITLFQGQYLSVDPTELASDFQQNFDRSGNISTSGGAYGPVISAINEFQDYVKEITVNRNDSKPAAEWYNIIRAKLDDIYEAQPLLGGAIIDSAKYESYKTTLGKAMLLRGSAGIAVIPGTWEAVRNLDNSDIRKQTLLNLYRDIFEAQNTLNSLMNRDSINAYLASQAPPVDDDSGYLARLNDSFKQLKDAVANLNTGVETKDLSKRKQEGKTRTRKATLDAADYLKLKNAYDQVKFAIREMMRNLNVDMEYAANQFVGDQYYQGMYAKTGQMIFYNGNVYKCLQDNGDGKTWSPPASGANWELMNWNTQRGSQYEYGDVVRYNGQLYRCITTHYPSSNDAFVPGNLAAQSNWQPMEFQAGHTYLPGDTVLIQRTDSEGISRYVPYVCQKTYTSSNISEVTNANLGVWSIGYNAKSVDTITTQNGIATGANVDTTLGSMTAIVKKNGTGVSWEANLNPTSVLGNYNSSTGQYAQGNAFTTLNNASNNATTTDFIGWADETGFVNSSYRGLAAGVGSNHATTYDGMQFFSSKLALADNVMQNLQKIDLFYYSHQLFQIKSGANFLKGWQSPIIALSYGMADEGGSNAYKVGNFGQFLNFIKKNSQTPAMDTNAIKSVYAIPDGSSYSFDMGNTTSNGWADTRKEVQTNFYMSARALAGQLKTSVSSYQADFNEMMRDVQEETRSLLVRAFINTIDLEASLKTLFRNAPLSDDEKKLLAKILAVIMSLLISILGASPQIRNAFTQQLVTTTSKSGVITSSQQWVFDEAFANIRISKNFADSLIQKAVALAGEMLSDQQKRGGSVTADRITTRQYLNMAAFVRAQEEAVEKLDRQNTLAPGFV